MITYLKIHSINLALILHLLILAQRFKLLGKKILKIRKNGLQAIILIHWESLSNQNIKIFFMSMPTQVSRNIYFNLELKTKKHFCMDNSKYDLNQFHYIII